MMSMMRRSSFSSACMSRVVAKHTVLPAKRMIHIDTEARTHQDGAPEIMLYDMISLGTHSSTESITKFMNALYVNKPRSVSLFSYNYRQRTERSTIRGVCIGTNNRQGSQKNVVIASGLPLQDPSLIGVGLYVAAMLSRMSPMLPRDVSVIPLVNPKEYEQRWKSADKASAFRLEDSSAEASLASNWLSHENVTLELKDNCKPLETYLTRKNKYFINLSVDLSTQGSSLSYKGNSLSQLASKGKYRDFFMNTAPPSLPLPSFLFPNNNNHSSSSSPSLLIPEPKSNNSMVKHMIDAPSIVIELKGTQALDDNQVVRRGEEVICMLKDLLY